MNDRPQQLATLNAIGEVLNREPEFESAAPEALRLLVHLAGLTTGWLFVSNTSHGDSHAGSFSLAADTGLPPALMADGRRPLCSGGCECQSLFRRHRLDRGVNMVTCSRLAEAVGDKGELELHASVPLLGSQGPLGIMNLAAPGREQFDRGMLAFLSAVGKQLGVALERSRLQAQRTDEARYLAVLEERERLARHLHDSLAQLLFAADLSLQAALADDTGGAGTKVERAADTVRSALADLRSLVEVQRPADLSGGLRAALARLVARVDGGPVDVHFDAAAPDATGPAAEALYRVAQEAVANALRHAQPRNVHVSLMRSDEGLLLRVRDDGDGFDPSQPTSGLGLDGMRRRVEAAGGSLTISSGRPEGTTVEAWVPWRGD